MKEKCTKNHYDEKIESFGVLFTNTLAYPGAVMIILLDTYLAFIAMPILPLLNNLANLTKRGITSFQSRPASLNESWIHQPNQQIGEYKQKSRSFESNLFVI